MNIVFNNYIIIIDIFDKGVINIMNELFGAKHIILMLISLALIVVGFIFSRKLSLPSIIKILFGIGIVSEIVKVFYYIITNEELYNGYLPKTDLPFHLCSIQIIFVVILIISKNEKIKRLLLSFMMPSCLFGGIMAIIIATNSSRNGSWIITTQYFGYHIAISIFGLRLIIDKEINWSFKDYINCLIFLGAIGICAIYLNSILNDGTNNINFMYVVNPPQDGLPYLNKDNGWLVYIIHYAFLAILLVSLVYIKPIINKLKSLREKAE